MQDTKAKSNRLFPRWQKGSDGYYSSVFSKWFNAQFLKKSGLKSPKHVFHSLRHNFKDALRNALIAPETQHRLMGHRSGHVGEQYGSGEIVESESNQIDRIRYSGLDLSHLYVSNPRTALPESGA
jgi:integrase